MSRDAIQTVRVREVVGLLSICLLLLSGCNRISTDTATDKKILPAISQPINFSGDMEPGEPAIAAAPHGGVYVVWVNHGPKTQADVMIAYFTGNGQMQGSPVRVNSQPGTATAWRGDPPTIVVAPDQTIFVGWTARVNADSGHATNLYLSASRDRGQTFSAPVKVNDDTKPADHGMHSLAVGDDGHLYVAWLDERDITPVTDMNMNASSSGHHTESNRALFASSSADGGLTFTPNRQVATDACPCCKTALAVAPDGRVYLSWRQVLPGDFRHIAVASSSDGGATFSKAVIVSDDGWVLKGCPVSGPSLSTATNGDLRVLWYAGGENSEPGIYWSESQNGGQSFSPRQLLAASIAKGTPVLLNDHGGNAIGVWEASEQGATQLLIAGLPPNVQAGNHPLIIGNGELPAVAATGDRLFIVSVKTDAEKPAIWLTTTQRPLAE